MLQQKLYMRWIRHNCKMLFVLSSLLQFQFISVDNTAYDHQSYITEINTSSIAVYFWNTRYV